MRNLVFIVCRVLAIVCVVYTILLLCPKCRRELTGRKLRVMLIKIRRVVRKYYYYYSDSKADERWSNGLPQEILLLILQSLCISDYLGEPRMCLLASCCGDGCCYQELPSSYSICASLLKVQTPPPVTLLSVGQVVTFWEREIVDTKNYTFFTEKWEATQDDDIRHWTKFPSFSALLSLVEVDGGKSLDLSNYPYIFMRWKEQYLVHVGTDCGLTIAGFYYVCFSCSDGSINSFYYDPNSRHASAMACGDVSTYSDNRRRNSLLS
ncbi:uncharacterized protein LOC112194134 [Rosa chinensis]|uniref:uncharacterized protein LOC112194134 n=1 Tax=Rosa chinensis TaxID=74649 RepID=UPI001AD9078B|nr:uncharacterized protein LOC112194134 [Rosa chinensis]